MSTAIAPATVSQRATISDSLVEEVLEVFNSPSGIALRLKNDDKAIALEIVERTAASAERPQPDLREPVEEGCRPPMSR